MEKMGKENTKSRTSKDFPSKRNSKGCRNFDDVIGIVGSTGKFQQNLLYFAISPISAVQPILGFNAVFMLFTPDHWCAPPKEEVDVWENIEEFKFVSIPLKNGSDGLWKHSSCTMYDQYGQEVKCTNKWLYDRKEYRSTITSEQHWVCDEAHVPTAVLLAGTLGNAFGIMIFGLLADNWGRKPTLFLAIVINTVFRFLSLFVVSYWYLLCLCQFFIGSTGSAMYIVASLIAAELCDKDRRAEVYAVTWTVCLFGLILLPFIAWVCGDWFLIGIVTASMGVLMLFYYPFIPESPRWLLQKGRVAEAVEILGKVQKCNEKVLAKRKKNSEENEETGQHYDLKCLLKQVLERQHLDERRISMAEGRGGSLEDRSKATIIFKKKNLATNTILLTICWSMNTLIYNIMTYNSTHMSGSHFKNFFLLGIIEVPSGFFGGYLADTLGRRWTQSLCFGLCALTCFATSVVVHQRVLEVILAMLGKMVATVSYLVVYCQAAELFPTELRSTGSAIASTVGNFITICAPVISELSLYSTAYPWLCMAGFSIIGMIAAAFLPETLNLRLPETIEEANNIGKTKPKKNRKYADFPDLGNNLATAKK